MVYTITFNPALDYIIGVKSLKTGLVNRTSYEKILPGGKGINVSIVLNNLGTETTALGFVGGFTGEEIEKRLLCTGIKTDFVKISGGASRINVKIKHVEETEINASGPAISEQEQDELFKKLNNLSEGDFLVLAGSVPESVPSDVYCDIMKKLQGRGIKIIADAEGELLERVLPYKPFLVKPNHHELGDFFGTEINTKEEAAEYARRLQSLGAENVFVSMASKGGVFAAEDGNAFACDAPHGSVINSTGAGDSAVAGFIDGYIKTGNCQNAFISGISAGSASAFSENLATADEICRIFKILSDSGNCRYI